MRQRGIVVLDQAKKSVKGEKMPVVRLQSVDGEVFPVDVEIARMSFAIRNMLDDLGVQDNDAEEVIPLPNVTGPILRKVIEWCTHHKVRIMSKP